MPVTPELYIASTAISIYAQYKSSQDKADALDDQGQAYLAQMKEIAERQQINESMMRLEMKSFSSSQAATFAKGGVDVGSGSVLEAMNHTRKKILRNIEFSGIQSQSMIDRAERLAKISFDQAGATREAAFFGALGTGIQGAYTASQIV